MAEMSRAADTISQISTAASFLPIFSEFRNERTMHTIPAAMQGLPAECGEKG